MHLLPASEKILATSEDRRELGVARKPGVALPFGKLISP